MPTEAAHDVATGASWAAFARPLHKLDHMCKTDGCAKPVFENAKIHELCRSCYHKARRASALPPRVVHRLSGLQDGSHDAVCSACGPVRVSSKGPGRGYKCKGPRKQRVYRRKQPHPPLRGVVAALADRTSSPDLRPSTWTKRQRKHWEKYRISPEDHLELIRLQSGSCAICGSPGTDSEPLVIDHCHESGLVRGLLCRVCNLGLGAFTDDSAKLEAAIAYLSAAHAATATGAADNAAEPGVPSAFLRLTLG